jgi:DNA mismatch repair ATPase MutS
MQSKRASIEEAKIEIREKIDVYKVKDKQMKEAEGRLHTERQQL